MRRKTIEDYAELLYDLQKEKELVHTNDVAFALNITPASVTEIFQKLSNERIINYKKYSGVTLTKKGKKIAISTKKRHDTLKKFLMILGIDKKIANMDACKIEHVVNSVTMEKLTRFVEFVQLFKDDIRWLDHFKYFCETGEYIECSLKDSNECPFYKRKKS
ncbi:MAG: metal-dependent transcriptional regulator [Petrotogales bacterium]